MATRKQITDKCNDIIENIDDMLKAKVQSALNSGALNIEEYNDDYIIPKAIISVALKSLADGYAPITRDAVRVADNLVHFI